MEEARNARVAMARCYAERAEEPQLCDYYTIPIDPDSSWWKYTLGDRVLFHNVET
eukprot:COSAG06_NODE_54280_length_295_cov_1.045918_1_plen_54_part_01